MKYYFGKAYYKEEYFKDKAIWEDEELKKKAYIISVRNNNYEGKAGKAKFNMIKENATLKNLEINGELGDKNNKNIFDFDIEANLNNQKFLEMKGNGDASQGEVKYEIPTNYETISLPY